MLDELLLFPKKSTTDRGAEDGYRDARRYGIIKDLVEISNGLNVETEFEPERCLLNVYTSERIAVTTAMVLA